MKQNETKSMPENAEISTNGFECEICSMLFKSRTTLWRHKKKCYNEVKYNEVKYNEVKYNEVKNNVSNDTNAQELIKYLMKENSEFKQLLIDQNKQMGEISKKSN